MKIKINNFEGPLDLLLQLIEKEELDITQVSLFEVADQYIDYLDTIENKKPDMLADFLLIASKLLYLKSKALLPELELEDEDDSIDLAVQLRMYRKFVEASKLLRKKFEAEIFAFSRSEDLFRHKLKFEPPRSLTVGKLNKVFEATIKRLDEMFRLPRKSLKKMVSISEKIKYIQKLLAEKDNLNFSQLAQSMQDKMEIIVIFLGMLEMVKQSSIMVRQAGPFDDIEIEKL